MAGLQPRDGTLVLTREFIASRVARLAYVEGVREAFRQYAAGDIALASVGHVPACDGAFHVKSAVRTRVPRRAVVKVNGNFPGNPARHGLPAIRGFIALLEAANGAILALMDSAEITGCRTAATSAVAAQLLARGDSRHLAIIGCGAQAEHHFDVFADLFAVRSVRLFDREPQRAVSLAQRAKARDIAAVVEDSPAAAARAADIIITSTPSRSPVLGADDVSRGCFIAAVGADSAGKQELAPALLTGARVVPDILAQALVMGDLQHAVAQGLMAARDIHGELADVITGRASGRRNDAETFVFDSTGTAIADLAAAELVFEAARADPDQLRVRLDG